VNQTKRLSYSKWLVQCQLSTAKTYEKSPKIVQVLGLSVKTACYFISWML